MELLVIMELILTVVVWVVLAAVTGEYAKRKGHEKGTWILVAILFSPLVAFIILLALGPKEQGLISSGQYRKCPQCAEMVRPDAKLCRYCKTELPPLSQTPAAQQRESGVTPAAGDSSAMAVLAVVAVIFVAGLIFLVGWFSGAR